MQHDTLLNFLWCWSTSETSIKVWAISSWPYHGQCITHSWYVYLVYCIQWMWCLGCNDIYTLNARLTYIIQIYAIIVKKNYALLQMPLMLINMAEEYLAPIKDRCQWCTITTSCLGGHCCDMIKSGSFHYRKVEACDALTISVVTDWRGLACG